MHHNYLFKKKIKNLAQNSQSDSRSVHCGLSEGAITYLCEHLSVRTTEAFMAF